MPLTLSVCLLNRGSPPAIVMGISGKMDELIYREKFHQAPLPVIRRFSGGGTVIVDHNTLFVTLICQADQVPASPFPRSLMQWLAELYRPLFSTQPFDLRENDYTLGERKWGGNAQSIIKGRWLHHSSLLWDYDPSHAASGDGSHHSCDSCHQWIGNPPNKGYTDKIEKAWQASIGQDDLVP